MKMYFVCDERGKGWWSCWGVLSNGFCFGQHICSSPDFAPHDLFFGRKERITALKEIFGIDPETVQHEIIAVRSKEDIPEWWDSHKDLQKNLAADYERYKSALGVEE